MNATLRAKIESGFRRLGGAELLSAEIAGNTEADAGVSRLTNGGVQTTDLGESHDKPVYRTRIDFYCGLALIGGKSSARLTNVLAG
ncbi:hypothetical protein [Streptomyces sp. NPDC001205]